MMEGSDTVNIEINTTSPGRGMVGTADMRFWRHIIEIDRALLDKDFVVTPRTGRYVQSIQHMRTFSTDKTNRASNFPSLVRITSVDELLYYYDQNRAFLPECMTRSVFGNRCHNASFFRMSALVILKLEETCGASMLAITSVCSPTPVGVVDIQISRIVSETGTDDVRYWYFVFYDCALDPSTLALVIRDY